MRLSDSLIIQEVTRTSCIYAGHNSAFFHVDNCGKFRTDFSSATSFTLNVFFFRFVFCFALFCIFFAVISSPANVA